MCNLKGRGHGYIIFEFIPESFLHPQLERNQMSWHWLSFLTFRRLAVLGSMTFRISRTSCVRDDPTWPCLIMNDLGIPSKWASRAFAPLRWVLVFLRLTMSRTWTKFKRKEGYRNIFVSKASTKYSEFHVHHAWNLSQDKWVACHHFVDPLHPPPLLCSKQSDVRIRGNLHPAHLRTKSNLPATAKSEPACKRSALWLKHGKTSSSSMDSSRWKNLLIQEQTLGTN